MRPVASLSLCLLPDLMHQPLAQILLRMRHRQVPWDRRVLEDVMTAGNADLSPARFLEFPNQFIALHWWLSYPPQTVAVNVAQSITSLVETCMTTNTDPGERDAAARRGLRQVGCRPLSASQSLSRQKSYSYRFVQVADTPTHAPTDARLSTDGIGWLAALSAGISRVSAPALDGLGRHRRGK